MSKRYLFTCKYGTNNSKSLECTQANEGPERPNEDPTKVGIKSEQDSGSPSQPEANVCDQGLYADHEIKEEMVLAPDQLQPQDIAISMQRPCRTKSPEQQNERPLHLKRQNMVWRSHNLRGNGQKTLVKNKDQHCLVQRSPTKQSRQASQQGKPPGGPLEPETAKMLIFLQNGEQRLITFALPKESCTLQEVLEQVNVPFSEYTHIQCMQHPSSEIDYFVSVGFTKRIEDMVENHPMLLGDRSRSPTVSPPARSDDNMSTPENFADDDSSAAKKKMKTAGTHNSREVDLSDGAHCMKIETFKNLIDKVPEERLEACWKEVVEVINKYTN